MPPSAPISLASGSSLSPAVSRGGGNGGRGGGSADDTPSQATRTSPRLRRRTSSSGGGPLLTEPAQPEAVGHHKHRTGRHREPGDQRVEQTERGQRDCGHVVGE